MKLFYKNKHGFTLTEIVSVLGITLLIILTVYNLFLISGRAFSSGDERLEIIQNGRVFLDRLTRELRQSSGMATALPPTKEEIGFPPAEEIMFQDGHGTADIQYLKYCLVGNLIKRQRIVYFFSAEPLTYVKWDAEDEFGEPPDSAVLEERVIAEYVNQLYFYGSSLTYIEVWLEKGDSTAHLFTGVWGRNTRS